MQHTCSVHRVSLPDRRACLRPACKLAQTCTCAQLLAFDEFNHIGKGPEVDAATARQGRPLTLSCTLCAALETF